jgi:arsenite/tail-anchored protein-transporting ATPase
VAELAFFVGKGGVGKTTVSAAYAVRTALKNRTGKILLISTDPAHSLADVLQIKLRDSPFLARLRSAATLTVWQMNAAALFRDFLRQNKQQMLELVERGSLFTAEEIAPLLDTALPGMSEMAALLAIQDALRSKKYSHIVVDTAPFGHTLRLFELPAQFERLLNFLDLAGGRDRVLAAHFGGVAKDATEFVDEWRKKVGALRRAFADSALFLVTTPERFALQESVRCIAELQRTNSELRLMAVVLNRVVGRAGKCTVCAKKVRATKGAVSFVRKEFSGAEIYVGQDSGFPIMATDGLRNFAEHVFARRKLAAARGKIKGPNASDVALMRAEWPVLATPLSFVVGKGGVGKTTVSAGLGLRCRAKSKNNVEICSVDPAPSLDEVFETDVGDVPRAVLGDRRFRASELDSVALFRKWVAEIKTEIDSATTTESGGVHIDLSFERQLFAELLEIVPPGLDEVLAIVRIMELVEGNSERGQSAKVIIDMAPTGHALELLRTPERILIWSRLLLKSLAAHRKLALARDAAVKIAELQLRARDLATALKSGEQAAIFGVMLAEPLPDRETERMLHELEEIGLSTKALFVNRIIFARDAGKCARCLTALRWQQSVLMRLRRRYPAKEIFVIRDFGHELAGQKELQQLTSELWRLQ